MNIEGDGGLPQQGARDEVRIRALSDQVRGAALSLHGYLRHGHLERVYEAGLAHRLRRVGLHVEVQARLTVYDDDGTLLGEFYADLVVAGCLIVELKARKTLSDDHTAQVLGYLRASGFRDAMLINFGGPRLQVRKFVL
ncbi:MAG: GxxExxY protein [Gemmatimonadota bacterium]|nr:GxxExxY protein [Gemmatimonadota bacterium]